MRVACVYDAASRDVELTSAVPRRYTQPACYNRNRVLANIMMRTDHSARLWRGIMLSGLLLACGNDGGKRMAAAMPRDMHDVSSKTVDAGLIESATIDASGLAPVQPGSEPVAQPTTVPGVDLLAPNEVDEQSAVSTLLIRGVEKYFSQPIRQLYREGNSDVPAEFSISYVVRFADGGSFNAWLGFDPERNAGEPVSQNFAKEGGLFLTDSPDAADAQEWAALSGTAVLKEEPGRAKIDLVDIELQSTAGDRQQIGSGSIEGVLERACYAHSEDQPPFADPVLDTTWSSAFCRPFR